MKRNPEHGSGPTGGETGRAARQQPTEKPQGDHSHEAGICLAEHEAADDWAPDTDILTRTCPKCGAASELPDCEACGHRFDSATVTYTIWPDVGGKTVHRIEGKPWTHLTGWIESQAEYKAKTACPLVKLASFGPHRTEKGSLRNDANVVEVFGIEGDYDAGQMTPEAAIARLEEFQVRATVYTSWSHTPEAPKWRVLAPLARPVAPAERLAYAETLNGMLGGILAPESGVLSQSYFVGRKPGAEYRVLHTFEDPTEGFCLDEIDGIEAERIAFRAKAEAANDPGGTATGTQHDYLAELLDGENVHGNALKIVARLVREGLSDSTIKTVFQGLAVHVAAARGQERAAELKGSELDRMIAGARAKGYAKGAADMDAFLAKIRGEASADTGSGEPEPEVHPEPEQVKAEQASPIQPPPPTPKPAIRFTPVCDLLEQPAPLSWLIRGVLLPGSQALVFGDPAVGKSLLTLSWAASVAMGRDWCGRTARAGCVIYLAGEGQFGIRRRLLAWALANDCLDALRVAPLFVSDAGTDLTEVASLTGVVTVVDGIAVMAGTPVLIVVDTLHRNIGGRDDSSSTDMGLYTRATDALIQRYGCTVLTVHHAGHGDKTRSRGSSAIRGALDVEFALIENDGIRTLSATKMKDAPKPPAMGFELEQIELPWRDAEGEPETSVVLIETEGAGKARKAVTPTQRMAFEALVAASDASGFSPPDDIAETLPAGARLVGLESWRRELYARHMGDSTHAKKVAFQRARGDLAKMGAIGHRDDAYWVIPGCGGIPELQSAMNARAIVRDLREAKNAA